jgi:intergrase/recombinase
MPETPEQLQKRLSDAEAIIKQATDYIAATQPVCDQFNQLKDRFTKRAHEVAGMLIDRGIIDRSKSNELVDKLAEDQTRALDLIEKLARLIRTEDLGSVSEIRKVAGRKLDPFEKLALFGDANAKVNENGTGLVD